MLGVRDSFKNTGESEVAKIDEKRRWRVIHHFTELKSGRDRLDVRMQREAHSTKQKTQRKKRTNVYVKRPAEVEEEEDELVRMVRRTVRENLTRVEIAACVD